MLRIRRRIASPPVAVWRVSVLRGLNICSDQILHGFKLDGLDDPENTNIKMLLDHA